MGSREDDEYWNERYEHLKGCEECGAVIDYDDLDFCIECGEEEED